MTLVGLLTIQQKNDLEGQLVQPQWYFYPIQDINDNWIITEEEIDNSVYTRNDWVKTLPLIPFKPKPSPNPFT